MFCFAQIFEREESFAESGPFSAGERDSDGFLRPTSIPTEKLPEVSSQNVMPTMYAILPV